MAVPTLTPSSTLSAIVLPVTGTEATAQSLTSYPFGIYTNPGTDLYDPNFVSGALDQVAYTFKKLGGDILDIELVEANVYAAYEESVLEYSYIVNLYQGKSMLTDVLGASTGTFDHDGHLTGSGGGDVLSSSLGGTHVALKFPRFDFAYSRRVADRVSEEVGIGGLKNEYSASVATQDKKQTYDLQDIVAAEATDVNSPFYNKVGNNRVTIKQVYYKTPHAMWRFYGYYGGMNSVGNLSTYGMFADDSTFEVIPPWQNKLQAMAYEDAIYTRNSHYSFELKNNELRLHPQPTQSTPGRIWFKFTIQEDAWTEEASSKIGADGINNLNTIPFGNLPYKNINSIGKQWIRRFALALTKEMLGQVRGKFATIPIPGESVTLNASDLLSQAKEEQEKLREELKKILDELTYDKLAETEAKFITNSNEALKNVPTGIFML
tara:strand:+ start:49185 stop:50489 length:1305 start_codon:yes stop_codon:yes gene_type:complete